MTKQEALIGQDYIRANTVKQKTAHTHDPYMLGNAIGKVYLSKYTDNPFPEGSEDYTQWREGFTQAKNLLNE